jgi:hypothetical protein
LAKGGLASKRLRPGQAGYDEWFRREFGILFWFTLDGDFCPGWDGEDVDEQAVERFRQYEHFDALFDYIKKSCTACQKIDENLRQAGIDPYDYDPDLDLKIDAFARQNLGIGGDELLDRDPTWVTANIDAAASREARIITAIAARVLAKPPLLTEYANDIAFLKAYKARQGVTWAEVAARIGIVPSTLYAWKKNPRSVRQDTTVEAIRPFIHENCSE